MTRMGAVEKQRALDESRFEVRGNLGTGGMGVVYRANDRRLGRDVAMKALRHATGRDLYRFKREFRSLADIVHPNLVALYELHTQGDEWFFTMELVDGCSFIDWVRPSEAAARRDAASEDPTAPRTSGRTRPEIVAARTDAARLAAALPQLCDGVLALHVAGKLHRDLKPSNVLVDRAGRVVLLDFGLVSELDDGSGETDKTHERAAVGTPAYMSPEQAADQPLTEASDWYAVGVMLYEALTGRRPFEGTAEEVMRRKQTEVPPSPRTLAPDAPPELDALCMQLLRRHPKDRPDGRAVLAALGREPSSHTTDLARASHAHAFVGRQAELGALRRALTEARRRTVAAFVVGASGMGKTQLVRRFLDDIGDKALILEGRCYERESVPYKMLDTVVDALATGLLRMPPARLEQVLPRDVAALARLFPVLRRVPAIADRAVGQSVPPDPQELRRRGFGALRFLFGRLAAIAPLVLCIDDVQWGDADSAVFVSDLIHHPEPTPMLVLLVHRPEDDSGVVAQMQRGSAVARSTGDVRSIEVGPFTRDEAALLVAQLGGDATAAASVIAEAGGHPLYLAELARESSPGGAAPDLDALLAARIGQLAPSAAALLRVVAVAGRPLRLDDAVRAAGSVAGWELGRLRAERLVRVRRLGEDEAASLEPYHDRVRVAALAGLDPALQRQTHRALAETVESRGPGERDFDDLVDHWEGAGESARAAEYAVRAAAAAEEAMAFHRAAALYALALEQTPPGDAARALHLRRATALANAGQLEGAAAAFAAAAVGAEPAEVAELDRRRLEQILRRGDLDEGLALSEKVLARYGLRLPPSHAAGMRSLILARVWLRLRGLGFKERRPDELTKEELERIDTLYSVSNGLSFVDPLLGKVVQHHYLRYALAAGDPYRVGIAITQEIGFVGTAGVPRKKKVAELSARSEALAQRVQHPHLTGLSDTTIGLGHYLCGEWRQARERIERGSKVLRDHAVTVRWEIDIGEVFTTAAMWYQGDIPALVRLVPLLLRDAVERGDIYAQRALRGWRSNVAWLCMGQPGDARAHVMSVAVELRPGASFNLHRWYELISHGQIDLYLRDGEAARARVAEHRRAMAKAHLTGIQSVRVETEFMAARAAIAMAVATPTGEAGKRAELLAEARTAIRALERERAPWAGALAHLARGAALAASGDYAAAATSYADAERELTACEMALMAHVARLRRGECEGGPVGAARAQAALDWMREHAVADPAAMAQMLAPAAD